MKYFIIFFLILGLYCACTSDEQLGLVDGKDLFAVLGSETTGVDFVNTLTDSDSFNIIQYLYYYNGAGVAAADLNGDGNEDLIFNSNQSHPRIYINNGTGDISFTDVSASLKLDTITGWGTGVAIADVNNDGLQDIYLCQVGNYKSFKGSNRLLINKGMVDSQLSLEDKTEEYGLSFSGLSTHAAFLDYDIDGDLDMYLLNHSTHQTSNYAEASQREIPDDKNGDRIYRNDKGAFVDVTKQTGIYNSKIGYGLGIAISDLDHNGYPDIYIGNDFHENDYLYLNQGDGTFNEHIGDATDHNSQFSMGVDIADVNEDGWSDIFTLDMKPEDPFVRQTTVGHDLYNIFLFKNRFGYQYQLPSNHLHMHSHNANEVPRYKDLGHLKGIDATDWSWSVLLEDFDHDGNKDVFISNGIARRPNDLDYLNFIANEQVQNAASDLKLLSQMPEGSANNYFYLQSANQEFQQLKIKQQSSLSTGACMADLDNDGDLEIITNNINSPATIYKNQANKNFLSIKLKDKSGLNGIGSRLRFKIGKHTCFREVNPYKGMMSSTSPRVVIGLNDIEKVDSLMIVWPTGSHQLITDIKANQNITIEEKEASLFKFLVKDPIPLLKKVQLNGVDFLHDRETQDNIKRNTLIPFNSRKEGPALSTADLNGDGVDDFFLGNSNGFDSKLFLSDRDGNYSASNQDQLMGNNKSNVISASFVDLDNDLDKDLIVVSNNLPSGGFQGAYKLINEGNGNFGIPKSIGLFSMNSSGVAEGDFDQDGDKDLFFGEMQGLSSSAMSNYTSSSTLLINQGDSFEPYYNRELFDQGSVTDAQWGDIDGDGDEDLILVAMWNPITMLINKGNGFSIRHIDDSEGLWRSLELADLDSDGKLDIIAGNFGLNSELTATEEMPLRMYDIQSIIVKDDNVLVPSIDEIFKHLPKFKKSFTDYNSFAQMSLKEKFHGNLVEPKIAKTLRTQVYKNLGDTKFKAITLPIEAQYSCVNDILIDDINSDGFDDMILVGNDTKINTSIGMQLSSAGCIILNQGDMNFESLDSKQSGLSLDGVANSVGVINHHDTKYYLFGMNGDSLQVYTRAK